MNAFSTSHSRVFVSFSGGKDSVATYIRALEVYPKHIITLVFCDTGDELPETYEYLKYFDKEVHPITRLTQTAIPNGRRQRYTTHKISVDLPLAELRDNFYTVFDAIRYKSKRSPGRQPFPHSGIRHCTRDTKIHVFNRYVREKVKPSERRLTCIALGVRRLESTNRSQTPETKHDVINNWDVWYPIVHYTLDDVLLSHKENDIRVNQSYKIVKRSNCVGCPFGSIHDIKRIVDKHGKSIIQNWIDLEDETGFTWKKNQSIRDYDKLGSVDKQSELLVSDRCDSGYCEF